MTDNIEMKFARAVNAVHAVTKDSDVNLGAKIGTISYASIGTVLTHVKRALHAEGLALLQPVGYITSDGNLPVMTINTQIIDTANGAKIEFDGPGFPVKGDPQAAGGAMTYFRRYSLVSLFGLIVEDDDGTQATQMERNPQERTNAELQIRQLVGAMDTDKQKLFMTDFVEKYGKLIDLDSNRHGEALGWSKNWVQAMEEETDG